jgi:hypothetical protein
VFYITFGEAQRGIWRVPIAGGEPIRVVISPAPPDAAPAVVTTRAHVRATGNLAGRQAAGRVVPRPRGARVPDWHFAIDTGELMKSFDHLFYMLAWTRDGRAMTYADVKDGAWNLWNQPIDGGPPKPMTNFTSDQIFGFGWSDRWQATGDRAMGPSPTTSCLVSNLPRNR